jgi:adenine phosphoribosyltransferase
MDAMLRSAIRDVPDFPKPGIMFKDLSPVLQDPALFNRVVDALAERYQDAPIDRIVAVEARGFLFGSALAYRMHKGLALVRKPGKLPWRTAKTTYDLEYGTDTLEIHLDAVEPGHRVLIVDDLLATGGTVGATVQLVHDRGASVYEAAFVVELAFLNGREKLRPVESFALVSY